MFFNKASSQPDEDVHKEVRTPGDSANRFSPVPVEENLVEICFPMCRCVGIEEYAT